MIKILSLLGITTLVTILDQTSARLSLGSCDQADTVDNFVAANYMGTWYEIMRDAETSFEAGGSCTTAEYTLNNDNSIVVLNE